METKCDLLPMPDMFDDYVRLKGINIGSMMLMAGIFAHWMHLSSVAVTSTDALHEWNMIVAWILFAIILPSIIAPLLTFGNNNPGTEKSPVKIIVAILVTAGFTVEAIVAFAVQTTIDEENGDISDLAYYLFFTFLFTYILSALSGISVICLYIYMMVSGSYKSYHETKTKLLRELNEVDRIDNNGSSNNDENQQIIEENSEIGVSKESIKTDVKEELERGKSNIRNAIDYLWPKSKFNNELTKYIPIPSRVYQVLFIGIIGLIFDLEISIYVKSLVDDAVDEADENIAYLKNVLETYEDIEDYDVSSCTEAVSDLSSIPAVDQDDVDTVTSACSIISDAQANSDDAIDALNYALDILRSGRSFGEAFSAGIIIGIVCATITGLWSLIIVHKAYYKKYLNLRHNSPEFRYHEEKYRLFWTSRFMGSVGSYLAIGPLLTIFFIATIIALLGWNEFHEFLESYWFYIFYIPLLWVFEVFVVRNFIQKKIVQNTEESLNGRKVLRINGATFWLWWMNFNDIVLFPVSYLFALLRYVFLQIIVIASYLRPDISIMPPNMEDWDTAHTTFVSTVQAMLQRELVFVMKQVDKNGGAGYDRPDQPSSSDAGGADTNLNAAAGTHATQQSTDSVN